MEKKKKKKDKNCAALLYGGILNSFWQEDSVVKQIERVYIVLSQI